MILLHNHGMYITPYTPSLPALLLGPLSQKPFSHQPLFCSMAPFESLSPVPSFTLEVHTMTWPHHKAVKIHVYKDTHMHICMYSQQGCVQQGRGAGVVPSNNMHVDKLRPQHNLSQCGMVASSEDMNSNMYTICNAYMHVYFLQNACLYGFDSFTISGLAHILRNSAFFRFTQYSSAAPSRSQRLSQ